MKGWTKKPHDLELLWSADQSNSWENEVDQLCHHFKHFCQEKNINQLKASKIP